MTTAADELARKIGGAMGIVQTERDGFPDFRAQAQLACLSELRRQGRDIHVCGPLVAGLDYAHLDTPADIERRVSEARIETDCVVDLAALVDAVLRSVADAAADGRFSVGEIVKRALEPRT